MKIFKTWVFKWWEISFLKICLISLGIIIGVNFRDNLIDFMRLWWILFIVTLVYFFVRMAKEK